MTQMREKLLAAGFKELNPPVEDNEPHVRGQQIMFRTPEQEEGYQALKNCLLVELVKHTLNPKGVVSVVTADKIRRALDIFENELE